MARLSVRLIADERDEGIALLNSQTTAGRMKNIQNLLQHMNKKNDSETAFKYLNQRGKIYGRNYVFHILFHAISGR
jgi:hypothetical protein